MKQFICIVVALILTCACACAETYPQAFVVSDVNYNEDLLIMTDYNGYTWICEGIEDFCIGDIIAVIMDDCDTEYIFDDTILEIKYAGYMEG